MTQFYRSVCFSVCSLLRYHLSVFLFALPEVGCPTFLEFQNPWGKVMERSGFTFEIFTKNKIAAQKKLVFGQILQGTWGYTARIGRLYNKDQEVIQQESGGYVFWRDYRASPETLAYKGCKITPQKKFAFFIKFCLTSRIFLVSVLLSVSVERCFVSRKRYFLS